MHAFPESLLLFGVGLMNLMLAFGLAAIRTKPAAAENAVAEDEPALGVTPEPS